MKKAKFMFAAIAVLAIAGGVYASKAHRLERSIFIRQGTETTCGLELPGYNTVPFAVGDPIVGNTTLTLAAGPCTQVKNYYTAQ
jgi:hypothetical protein